MTELWRLDASAQAALVQKGELSASELVDAAIDRTEALEPALNALSSHDFDAARARASGELSGPFAGVPFLVKDLVGYPGLPHRLGSRLFAGQVAAEHTPYSAALEAAGLVVLGKSTTSELGLMGSTETLLDGPTLNPWDRSLSASGSSGGSAAAVAARMVPFAHASDGGGSIRIPAAINGVFGLKPSGDRMRVSGPGDMQGLVVDHCVSWSVRDSARLLALTEQKDGPLAPVGFVDGPLARRLRIGAYDETLLGARPSPANRRAFEQTMALCESLGHEVIVVEPHALSLWGLYRYLRYMEQTEQDAGAHEVAFWGKLAQPLLILAMIFIAIPILLGSARTTGTGIKLFIGIVIGILFYLVSRTFTYLALLYGLSPAIAAFAPLALFAMGAWALLRRVG